MSDSALEATVARLSSDVEDGFFSTGAQAVVIQDGEVLLDAAFGRDGLGRPMTVETISAVYCAIKPMFTVLLLIAVQEGHLRLDTRLGEVLRLEENPALAAVQFDELLSHRAGLHLQRSLESAAVSPALRHDIAMKARPPEHWDPGRQGAYSEWLGFYLIGQALEATYAADLSSLLRDRVLIPLGLASDVFLGLRPELIERIGVNVQMQAGDPLPLLIERTGWFAAASDPSLSPFATMRGLARFYAWVHATLEERESGILAPELLRQACTPARSVVHDQILDLEADWGLGFMTGLSRLGFGPFVSPRAVGHTGQVGTSMAFCDPEHNLAAAVLYNGVIDQKTGMTIRRPAIVGAIYRDLGLDERAAAGSRPAEAQPALS